MRQAIVAVALFASACVAAAQGREAKFDPKRDAAADVAQAVARAGQEGKRVIVDVGGEWCIWCHILDRFIASHDDVRKLVESDFVWVKVNYSPENKNEKLLAAWPKTQGYPHLFVLDGSGKLVRSQETGVLEQGRGYDEAKVLAFLREVRVTR